jgi:hypothetical protein
MGIDRFKETEASIHEREDRDLEVFKDGEFWEDIHDLKRATDSLLYPFMDGEMGDFFIVKKDLSRVGQNISGQEIDKGCFTRSIGPDNGGEHSFFDLEVNIICGADHTKIFSKFLCPEEFCHEPYLVIIPLF